MLVSFPPLSNMLKSSGSSCQFEARLGRQTIKLTSVALADDNRYIRAIQPTNHMATYYTTIDAVLRQPTTLVRPHKERLKQFTLLRCVSSLQATQHTHTPLLQGTVRAGTAQASAGAQPIAKPTQWQPIDRITDTASEDNRHSNRHAPRHIPEAQYAFKILMIH